jgi:hypothetical protein
MRLVELYKQNSIHNNNYLYPTIYICDFIYTPNCLFTRTLFKNVETVSSGKVFTLVVPSLDWILIILKIKWWRPFVKLRSTL